MTSRLIPGQRAKGVKRGTDVIVTVQWLHGDAGTPHEPIHEHVTLETPKALTETQRLRTLSAWEADKQWRSS
jgi:hypothetical protein